MSDDGEWVVRVEFRMPRGAFAIDVVRRLLAVAEQIATEARGANLPMLTLAAGKVVHAAAEVGSWSVTSASPPVSEEAWRRADIAEIERLLADLHPSRVAERIGLEARLTDQRRLARASEEKDTAR
jgi:hypothetical protein